MRLWNRSLPIILILFFSFATHLWRLHMPAEYMFDEVYHALTAKLIAVNDPRAFEWWHSAVEPDTAIDWLHPPLAKYTQAMMINLFGENSFSWRLSSALFGVGVVGLTYLLAKDLFQDRKIALIASSLTALDGLLLVQSRIAMNDIHLVFFILLSLWCYLRFRRQKQAGWLWLTGLSLGLTIATKWSGLFAIVVIGLTELITKIKQLTELKSNRVQLATIAQDAGRVVLALVILPAIIYVTAYGQMFLQGKSWAYFTELHHQIWAYQTNLKATHPYQSRPWEWFLNLKPVWIYVDYIDSKSWANIYAFGNPVLFWLSGMSVIWTGFYLGKARLTSKLNQTTRNLSWLWLAYWLVWLPWQLSPRIMFFYHYAPAVPLMSILLAYWLNRLWNIKIKGQVQWNKIMVVLSLALIGLAFIVWYPHWTGLPVSKSWTQNVYFFIPSWQ